MSDNTDSHYCKHNALPLPLTWHNYLIIIVSGVDVIRSLLHSSNDICISEFWCVLLDCTLVRAASGMGHWRKIITITCDIDYSYCYITKLYRLLLIHEFQTQLILLILDYYWQNTDITDHMNNDILTNQQLYLYILNWWRSEVYGI